MKQLIHICLILFCCIFIVGCGKEDYEPEPPQSVTPSDEVENAILTYLNKEGLSYPNYEDFEQIFSLYQYGNERLLLTKVKDETLWLGKFGADGKLIFSKEWKFSDTSYKYLKNPSLIGYPDYLDGKYIITNFFMNGKILFAIPYSNSNPNPNGGSSRADMYQEKYWFCGIDWNTGDKVWDGTDCPYINDPQNYGSYIFKPFGDYALLTPGRGKPDHIYCLKSDGKLLWHRDSTEEEKRNGLEQYNEAWFINDTEIAWYTYYSDYYTRGLRIVDLKDYTLVNKIYLRPYDSAGILIGDYDGSNNTCGDVVKVSFIDGKLLVDFDFYESYYKENEVTGGTNYVKNMLGQYRLTMTYPDGVVISKEKLKDY